MRIICDFKWGRIKSDEAGYVMVMAIFVLVIATLIGVSLAVVGINEYSLSESTKLMDVAYQIAEAGISRACVQIKNDPSIVSNTGGTAHIYKASHVPFWRSGSSPDYTEPFGAPGWGVTYSAYSVSIWQSELETKNPTYKVLVSTGKVKRGEKTAERTIEARIVAGASTQDYDASFDYLIYNGFYGKPWANPPVAQDDEGVWPKTEKWLGNFVFDGVSSYKGRSPKGVVYTRGSIDIPTEGLSSCVMHGNVIATNDITLANSTGVETDSKPGIVIDNLDSAEYKVPNQGNAVAGLDGSGNATLNAVHLLNKGVQPIMVTGYIAAANDVSVTDRASAPHADGSNQVGGIVAGGNVIMSAVQGVSISGFGMKLGNIFCAGNTTIISDRVGDKITFDQISTKGVCSIKTQKSGAIAESGAIYSGQQVGLTTLAAGNINVGNIFASFASSPITDAVTIEAFNSDIITGDIKAQGSVSMTNDIGTIQGANVTAGKDSSATPKGITIDAKQKGFTIQNLTAVGSISVKYEAPVGTENEGQGGSIWSGGAVDLNAAAESTWFKDISAYTYASVSSTTKSGGTFGRISANGNVNINCKGGTNYLDGIKAGGDVTLNVDGTTNCRSLDPWDQGPGTPDSTWPRIDPTQLGFDPMQDPVHLAIAAGGTYTTPGTGTVTLQDTTKSNLKKENLTPWIPGVDAPAVPDSPWYSGPHAGYPTGTAQWFDPEKAPGGVAKYDGPVVNQSTLLAIAGLEAPVQLLEPNWQFFLDAATKDQTASGKPHVLVDGVYPGDEDKTVNGVVTFKWTDDDYGRNETIYQGDPNVDVKIDINWQGAGSDFKGMLVTKGNVRMTNALTGGGWTFDTGQELDVVAGRDITEDDVTSDFYWVTAGNMFYHFWARGDIDFSTSDFSKDTLDTFNGSFIAGNRLYYKDGWKIKTWKWSRWAIDTAAWLPPFTVLSYKEI